MEPSEIPELTSVADVDNFDIDAPQKEIATAPAPVKFSGASAWKAAGSKMKMISRLAAGGRRRHASQQRRHVLSRCPKPLPALEEAMMEHEDFWEMRNVVLDYPANRVAEMLFESEQFFRNQRKEQNQTRNPASPAKEPKAAPNLFTEAGVNTLDKTFGWNIAMHCAALGKHETLQEVIDFHVALKEFYQINDGSGDSDEESDEELERVSNSEEQSNESVWAQPFPLDLGHKAHRTFDPREIYAHVTTDPEISISDEDLRMAFQGAIP